MAAGQGAVIAAPVGQPTSPFQDVATSVRPWMAAVTGVPAPGGIGPTAVLTEGRPAEGCMVARSSVGPPRRPILPALRAASRVEAPETPTTPTRVLPGTGAAAVAPLVGVGGATDGAPLEGRIARDAATVVEVIPASVAPPLVAGTLPS